MATAENKVYFGLSNVSVAFADGEETTFDTPTKMPGAVNLSLDAEGEQSVFYADNIAYYTVNSNSGYSGELQIARIPNALLAKMLGWVVDDNGALVEVADGVPMPFALGYQVQGDQHPRKAWMYNLTASRPSEEWQTQEDSTEVTVPTLPFTATPIQIEERNIVKAVIELSETNKTAYDGFFTSVYTPTFEAA